MQRKKWDYCFLILKSTLMWPSLLPAFLHRKCNMKKGWGPDCSNPAYIPGSILHSFWIKRRNVKDTGRDINAIYFLFIEEFSGRRGNIIESEPSIFCICVALRTCMKKSQLTGIWIGGKGRAVKLAEQRLLSLVNPINMFSQPWV